MNIEQHAAVLGLGSSHGAGDLEHRSLPLADHAVCPRNVASRPARFQTNQSLFADEKSRAQPSLAPRDRSLFRTEKVNALFAGRTYSTRFARVLLARRGVSRWRSPRPRLPRRPRS